MIYSEVVTAVEAFLNRTEADAFVPSFIALAEAEMNRRLDVREMTAYTVVSIAAEAVQVPCDFAGVKSFRLNSSPVKKLEYVRPDAFDSYQDQATTGLGPQFYTIVGDQFLFWPVVTTAQQAKLRYRSRLNALSTANFTNWASENHPDLYVYGALKHAGLFLADPRAGAWASVFDEAIERLNQDSITQNAGSTLQPQVEIYA